MSNYEPFFSLQRPLFQSDGNRGFVYESDQLKNAAESFKSAFSKPGPLLCLGGQLGCGKSSTVNFALSQLGVKTRVIRVGRVRLSEDEVIDLLLEKLDVDDTSGGTIKKLGRFAKRVEELRDGGERVVVVVEDAGRTGAHILSELEVLCGGDGGADVALVVCGDEDLRALIKTPELAHLSQRMNDFIRLAPFAVDELEDYLRHAVREAGGDYDSIFGKDFAGLTHILSCGVPRVANKLTEASLAAAAKSGTRKVSCALLADVAKTRFDIETELPVHRKTPETPKPAAAKPPMPEASQPAPAKLPVPAAPEPAAAKHPAPATQKPAAAKPSAPETPKPAAPKPSVPETPKPAAAKPPESARPQPQAAKPQAREAEARPEPPRAAAQSASRRIPDVDALTGSREQDSIPGKTAPRDFEIPHLIQDTQPDLKALSEDLAESEQPDATDSSGAFISLPNLEDLTAEFAAVSQLIESLPTSRYDEDEDNSEIEDAFGDFGALDKALEPPASAQAEQPDEHATSTDATSTALPKLKIPDDPTLHEGSAPAVEQSALDRLADEKPVAADLPSRQSPATQQQLPELHVESASPKAPEISAQPVTEKPAQDVPVLRAETNTPDKSPVDKPAEERRVAPAAETKANPPVEPTSKAPTESPADEIRTAEPVSEQKDWDRDPTLAELKPDFDALELAMGEDIELASEPTPAPLKTPEPEAVKTPAAMPEITLDNSIKEKVEEAAAESSEKVDEGGSKGSGGPSDTEVHRMMEDLSKASSLEDMDDKLAETLFGDEINLVASQVLKVARESMEKKSASAATASSPDTSIELSLEQTSENPVPPKPPSTTDKPAEKPNMAPAQFADDEGEVIDLKSMQPNSGLDMSASQRLRTVRALNAGMGKAPPPAQKPKAPAPPKEKPVPIEDQIDLSMTATFKALKIDPNALQQQQEEETEKKGFFSRFRKKG